MNRTTGGVVELDREDVKLGLAEGRILLVDVREPHEFAAGHIPGSLSYPLSRFDPASLPREPGKSVVLSCAAGIRSLQAVEIARLSGRRDIEAHYRGGFKDWYLAGEAVER